jgi:hypothetical protein
MLSSILIVGAILWFSYNGTLLLLDKGKDQWLPFASALIGVSLYSMSTAKTFRNGWDLRYLPDYCYRVAQSVVYLYIILAIMGQLGWGVQPEAPQAERDAGSAETKRSEVTPKPASDAAPDPSLSTATSPPPPTTMSSPPPQNGENRSPQQQASGVPDFTRWPPNLIGLLVGLFILHVEKAMEGFGQRFEEALTAVLGRSLLAKTTRERQIAQIRDEQKFLDIQRQSELIASQVRDPRIREAIQQRLDAVKEKLRDCNPDAANDEVEKLTWDFEHLKVALREEAMTLAEVLGRTPVSKASRKVGPG